MKKVVFLSVAMLLAASMAFGQVGSIGIFGDVYGTDCNLADNMPGLAAYYVVYVWHGGVTGAQFAAPQPACLAAAFLSFATVWPVNIGDQNGISIGMGQCAAPPTHLLTLQYFAQGLTGPCCYYPILPHPDATSGKVEGVDCTFLPTFPTAGVGIVNADQSCLCDVPTQDTTWGQVKSLFAE